jgi:outer membrane protein OmpA-like peptidoglycan-associated protein
MEGVMIVSKWFMLLFLSMLVGCESTTGLRIPSEFGWSSQGPSSINVTFLPQSSLHVEQVHSENILSAEGSQERRWVRKTSTEEGFSKDSRPANSFPTVFFPFDSWEIGPEVREQLEATAHWMNCFTNYGLRIEGHTDVQGTESYKMVLGAKRAHAVKEILSNLGVHAQRLETISYGKELIICDLDKESSCQHYNRRAELLLEQRKFVINTQARQCMVRLNFKRLWSDTPEGEARELALFPALLDASAG